MKSSAGVFMVPFLIFIILALVVGLYIYNRKVTPSSTQVESLGVLHYENVRPSFSFDYPAISNQYKIETSSSSVRYSLPSSDLDGPLDAYFEWEEISIKVSSDYWEKQSVNPNGIRYNLSDDESSLVFRLPKQGTSVEFNVSLPGGYIRKQEITKSIIGSFKEEDLGL